MISKIGLIVIIICINILGYVMANRIDKLVDTVTSNRKMIVELQKKMENMEKERVNDHSGERWRKV